MDLKCIDCISENAPLTDAVTIARGYALCMAHAIEHCSNEHNRNGQTAAAEDLIAALKS